MIIQGKLMCVHDDGTEILAEAGDAYYFALGHEGWVVGDETVVAYKVVDGSKSMAPEHQLSWLPNGFSSIEMNW